MATKKKTETEQTDAPSVDETPVRFEHRGLTRLCPPSIAHPISGERYRPWQALAPMSSDQTAPRWWVEALVERFRGWRRRLDYDADAGLAIVHPREGRGPAAIFERRVLQLRGQLDPSRRRRSRDAVAATKRAAKGGE